MSGPSEEASAPDEETERRRRVMERLAEILQGPPPGRGGRLSAEPDPEEFAALFRSLLEQFEGWQGRPRPDSAEEPEA